MSTSQNNIIKKNSNNGYYKNEWKCKLVQIQCHLKINDEQKKQRIMSRRNIKVEQKKKER